MLLEAGPSSAEQRSRLANTMGARVLIVDDDLDQRESLRTHLEAVGYRVEEASTVDSALIRLAHVPIDAIVSDVLMPERDGFDLLKEVQERHKNLPVVFLTRNADVKQAVHAFRSGADDYVLKDWAAEQIDVSLARALRHRRRDDELHRLKQELQHRIGSVSFITRNQRVLELLEQARRVAVSDSTVLLLGETGTGKELMAQFIHTSSSRKSRPFRAVNCGAIAPSVLESELFGHERGAFTGADARRVGMIESAQGGTLFLDEIEAAPQNFQVNLLRVLEARELYRVGAAQPIRLDVRIIAASNVALSELVKRNVFREDLYYRLSMVPIELLPLRQRPDDIELLIQHFEKDARQEHRREKPLEFTPEALRVCQAHHWPGNVRELRNLVHRLVLTCDRDRVEIADLPKELSHATASVPALEFDWMRPLAESVGAAVAEVERYCLVQALAHAAGNRAKAAKALGVSRRTLYNKLAAHGLEGEVDAEE